MVDKNMTLDELLKEIETCIGPYSRDRLKHAENVIVHMAECGEAIRAKLDVDAHELAKRIYTTIIENCMECGGEWMVSDKDAIKIIAKEIQKK